MTFEITTTLSLNEKINATMKWRRAKTDRRLKGNIHLQEFLGWTLQKKRVADCESNLRHVIRAQEKYMVLVDKFHKGQERELHDLWTMGKERTAVEQLYDKEIFKLNELEKALYGLALTSRRQFREVEEFDLL